MSKVKLEMSQEVAGLVAGLLGITAGEALQPLFDELKVKLDDIGYSAYEAMVSVAYDCLADEKEIIEDAVLARI